MAGSIMAGMQRAGARRLVYLLAFGVGDRAPMAGFQFNKIIRSLLLESVYDEHERAEKTIRESDLEWVIVRPSRLGDGAGKGRCEVDPPSGSMAAISKEDVAAFMAAQLESGEYLREAPSLFAG